MGTVRIKLVRGGLLDMYLGHSFKVQIRKKFLFVSYWETITEVHFIGSALEVKELIEEGKVII